MALQLYSKNNLSRTFPTWPARLKVVFDYNKPLPKGGKYKRKKLEVGMYLLTIFCTYHSLTTEKWIENGTTSQIGTGSGTYLNDNRSRWSAVVVPILQLHVLRHRTELTEPWDQFPVPGYLDKEYQAEVGVIKPNLYYPSSAVASDVRARRHRGLPCERRGSFRYCFLNLFVLFYFLVK